MIENRIRDAFDRLESRVPDAGDLVAAINTRARRRRARRWLQQGAGAAVAVALVLAMPILGQTLLPGNALGPARGQEPSTDRALNFLVVGLDRRTSWSDDRPARTDAIVLVHVPADRSAVQLITIPRDLEVDIPASSRNNGMRARVNTAYLLGGFPLLAQTVTDLTRLHLDGGAVVDFAGLVKLVDQFGGLRFCVDQRTESIHTGRIYEPGCRIFAGAEMKDFLRQRILPNGALDRDRHNAQFLAALIRQVGAEGHFSDLGRMRAAYSAIKDNVVLDTRGTDPVGLAWDVRRAFQTVVAAALPAIENPPLGTLAPARSAAGLFDALRTDTVAQWLVAHPSARIPLG